MKYKINEEYELFKALCQSQSIEITQNTIPLIEKLEKKHLQVSKDDQAFFLADKICVLSETKIRSGMNPDINESVGQLKVIFATDSTNKLIATFAADKLYSILAAEYQSEGQGRREKNWVSPLGCNIYLSIQFQLKQSENAQFIPLITARSVCKALAQSGVDNCMIKWPNDIYLDDKKVAGILVENRYNSNKGSTFVVGIGINVNMQENDIIDQQWTSLRNSQNRIFDRNKILSDLLSQTLADYNQLSNFNIQQFKDDWETMDYLKGKKIQVSEEFSNFNAFAHGISDDGALIIERDNIRSNIYSAEVSVRPLAIPCVTQKKD